MTPSQRLATWTATMAAPSAATLHAAQMIAQEAELRGCLVRDLMARVQSAYCDDRAYRIGLGPDPGAALRSVLHACGALP